MTIELERVRRDTRACEVVTHFNNAGASLPPSVVMDTVREHLRSEEAFGGYEAQELAKDALAAARGSVAQLIGARAADVAFFDSSTRAWLTGLYALDWKPGDRIVTAEAEYPSNVFGYHYLRERFGVEVDYAPDDASGQVDVDALCALITDRTRLITLTHVPTYSGLINPAAAVGAVAREAGVPFLLDACQSAGQLHLDVEELGCDLLAAAGRKYLRGPRGSAFLWIRPSMLERMRVQFSDNHGAAWTAADTFTPREGAARFETFERAVALELGLGAAARYAVRIGTRDIEERVIELGAELRGGLGEVGGVTIHDRGARLGGIVTFTVASVAAAQVAERLRAAHINVSVTTVNAAQRAFAPRGIDAVVRASAHYFNTHEEIARTVAAVAALRS